MNKFSKKKLSNIVDIKKIEVVKKDTEKGYSRTF